MSAPPVGHPSASPPLPNLSLDIIKDRTRLISVACLVTAVVFALIGLSIGGLAGILLTFLAGAFVYVGYNGLQVSHNIERIIKRPDLILASHPSTQIDSQKIKGCLKEKSYWFGPVIDIGVDYILKNYRISG